MGRRLSTNCSQADPTAGTRPAEDESLLPDGQQLADVLSEFARTMLTDFPIQAILDHLVERIVDILPISSAGVTLISPGTEPHYIAATNADALRYEKLQSELAQGPCLLAYETGAAITVPDLRTEERFPIFGPRANKAGLAAVFTFPLSHGEHRLGALDLYRQHTGPLYPKAISAAQTLADVVTAYLLNARARADLQDSSDRSREAALHDPLTGLPNRVLLLERMEDAFARSRRSGNSTVALFVDLDQFKSINDTYGHRVGDELLVAVARRVAALIRPGDTLARLSGDEFVAICDDLDSPHQAAAIGARVEAGLAPPFQLSEVEIAITASIGIAYADHSAHADYSPKQLVHEADMAMYQAKREGGHRRVFQTHHLALTGLEQDLPGALRRGEFYLEYQPILATADRRITGFEALLRWRHPRRGLVPAAVFLPLAENAGLINHIGQWVLEQAWADRNRWQTQFGGQDLEMSVDISAHHLMSAGFTDSIAHLLRSTDDPPGLLILEITESTFLQDSERALLVLNDLKDLGIKLALDDFGIGYSSLSYLKRFPVDIIKIDRSFIADLDHNAASHTIVDAVVGLAHGLAMTVVAEGVETEEQLDRITGIGCDKCQGLFLARPTPVEGIPALIGPTREPVAVSR